MVRNNTVRALKVPAVRTDLADVHRPLRVLSLTGGGYRGLFTAKVLVELCKQANCSGPLNGIFNVFGGTSIGGLMACALAVGVSPQRVVDAIDANGPAIFARKRFKTGRRALFGTLYNSDALAKAIRQCLGNAAQRKLKDIDATGVLVPAVDWKRGAVDVFMSGAFGKAHASDATLLDVCLATSAAPTYFKPHVIDGRAMLDGGLVANNPDAIILVEIARRWPHLLKRTEVLSIGAAGGARPRTLHEAEKSGLAWATEIATYMITVQERTAAEQSARMLGPNRYLRINHNPKSREPAFENLDLADDNTRARLMETATAVANSGYVKNRKMVDRMLAASRS